MSLAKLPPHLSESIVDMSVRMGRVERFETLEYRARHAARESVRRFVTSLVAQFNSILEPEEVDDLASMFASSLERIIGPAYFGPIPDVGPSPTTPDDLDAATHRMNDAVERVANWFFMDMFEFLDKIESQWIRSAYIGYIGTEMLRERSADFGALIHAALTPFHDALYDLLDDRVSIDLTASPGEQWMWRFVSAVRRIGPSTLWIRSGPYLMPEARLLFAEAWMSAIEDVVGSFFTSPFRYSGEDMRPGTPGFRKLMRGIHMATAEASQAIDDTPPFVETPRDDLPMALYQSIVDLVYETLQED